MKKITSKYINEFNSVSSKEEFVKLLNRKYKVKKVTALRRYYDCKQVIQKVNISIVTQKPLQWKYGMHDKIKPHPLKIIILNDMIRFKTKVDRKMLQQHGFNNLEINWAVDEGLITLDEKILY